MTRVCECFVKAGKKFRPKRQKVGQEIVEGVDRHEKLKKYKNLFC